MRLTSLRPKLPSPRRAAAIASVLLSLTLASTALTPSVPAPASVAAAATAARPAQVGLVSFVGAALTSDGKASLTVSWPAVKTAVSYEVFVGTTYANVLTQKTARVTTRTTKAVVPGLTRGKDYFVQVRAVNAQGKAGNKSSRVGHGTILAEGSGSATKYSLLTWNICSNKCSGFSARQKLINARIVELSPSMVTLQEATEYTKAPTGYGFAYKGRSTVLYDKDVFSLAVTGEQTVPSAKYGPAGGGISWGVLKDKSTGRLSVVFSTHLKSGDSKSAVKQRVYEAGKIAAVVRSTMAMLRVEYPKLAWDTAATFVAGDINSNKSRTTDGTIAAIEKTGWHDAFDQARVLVKQHQNSANGSMSTTPRLGITWGDHIDQVLVQPSKTVVLKWSNVQKMSKGKYVKLASDHLPIMVTLRTNP